MLSMSCESGVLKINRRSDGLRRGNVCQKVKGTVSSRDEQANKTAQPAVSDDEWILELLHRSGWRFRKRWPVPQREVNETRIGGGQLGIQRG